EDCGHALTATAVAAATTTLARAAGAPDATTLVPAPNGAPPPGAGSGVEAGEPSRPAECAWCGSELIEDGFCTACGVKQRTWRDHW
ncbi:MAG TPA: hypothetical protein PLV68_11880, partial [Ilumatobacteraceae bacterium]|nr:hypothetical protein [Ilumatobacteraceae bacterium]